VSYPAQKDHPLFRLPVFCSLEFVVIFSSFLCLLIVVSSSLLFSSQSYVGLMRVKLAMLSNVGDTSLDASLPKMKAVVRNVFGKIPSTLNLAEWIQILGGKQDTK
jgi:hypothetical protein